MYQGWVKLHRKALDNPIRTKDRTAWSIFTDLLLVVDRNGTYTTGRWKLESLTGFKGTTAYQALRRLEKYGMIKLSSDNKMTTISICNWAQYQSSDDNKVTTKRQQNDTKQEYKNEEFENQEDIEGDVSLLKFSETQLAAWKAKFSYLTTQEIIDEIEKAELWLRKTGKKYQSYVAFMTRWLIDENQKKKERYGTGQVSTISSSRQTQGSKGNGWQKAFRPAGN